MCYQNRRCEHTFRLSFYLIKLLLNKHSDIIDNLDIYNVNYLFFFLYFRVLYHFVIFVYFYILCVVLFIYGDASCYIAVKEKNKLNLFFFILGGRM